MQQTVDITHFILTMRDSRYLTLLTVAASSSLDSRHFCSSLPRHRGVRLNRQQARAAND